MQLIKRRSRIINYFGIEFEICYRAGFIATDSDGDVYWYSELPKTDNSKAQWFLIDDNNQGFSLLLAWVDLGDLNWKDTLKSTKDITI